MKQRITRLASAFALFMFVLGACRNLQREKSMDGRPGSVYFDYKIRGDDSDDFVTVYIQYRVGGPNGSTLILNDPSKVELDGEEIPVDSARLTGAFYEIRKPAATFAGKHSIVFTDLNEKKYREDFEYQPLGFESDVPAILKRGDISFGLSGTETGEPIRIMATDTSFSSPDINEMDTAKSGGITITASRLKNLVNGPIILLLSKEKERQVTQRTMAGGKIIISSVAQKEFLLK